MSGFCLNISGRETKHIPLHTSAPCDINRYIHLLLVTYTLTYICSLWHISLHTSAPCDIYCYIHLLLVTYTVTYICSLWQARFLSKVQINFWTVCNMYTVQGPTGGNRKFVQNSGLCSLLDCAIIHSNSWYQVVCVLPNTVLSVVYVYCIVYSIPSCTYVHKTLLWPM